jgi:hypothetical protein
LPSAISVAGGGGSGTTMGLTSIAAVSVVPATDDTGVMAPSGNGTQRHLIFAGNQWWVFYPTAHGVNVRTSRDFELWQQNPDTPGGNAVLGYDSAPPPGLVDGRTFGVDTETINGSEVIHMSLSGPATSSDQIAHARTVVASGTSGLGLGFDPANASATVDNENVLSAGQVDGTVTLIALPVPCYVFDFASLAVANAPQDDSWVLSAATPDTGEPTGQWTGDFDVTPLPDHKGGPAVPIRGAVPLPGYVAVLWPSQNKGALLWSETPLPPQAPSWSAPALVGTTMGGRDWGVCAEPGTPTPAAHLLTTDGTSFHHFENVNGTDWIPQTFNPNALSVGASVSELFLACDTGEVHAFTILSAEQGYPIQETVWDGSTGQWSEWTTVVEPSPAIAQRCYLAGFDRVVKGVGIGLLWTESDDCTAPAPVQLFGALVAH